MYLVVHTCKLLQQKQINIDNIFLFHVICVWQLVHNPLRVNMLVGGVYTVSNAHTFNALFVCMQCNCNVLYTCIGMSLHHVHAS